MSEKLIAHFSKWTGKIRHIQNLPIKAMGSSQDPLVSNDWPSTQVVRGHQLHLQADLPGPLPQRRVCSSHNAWVCFRADWKVLKLMVRIRSECVPIHQKNELCNSTAEEKSSYQNNRGIPLQFQDKVTHTHQSCPLLYTISKNNQSSLGSHV